MLANKEINKECTITCFSHFIKIFIKENKIKNCKKLFSKQVYHNYGFMNRNLLSYHNIIYKKNEDLSNKIEFNFL